jgi:alkanesulfonate monooxygenase
MTRPLTVLWQINATDGETPWLPETRYPANFEKLTTLAARLDELGYFGALTTAREAIALVSSTTNLRFLVPEYPGVKPAALLAEEAQVFDAYSGGRLIYNQINGRDPILERYGVNLDHDTRYHYSEEYWTQFKKLYADDHAGFSGEHFSYGPQFKPDHFGPRQTPHTPVWGSGQSAAGLAHAGRVLDAYLFFLADPAAALEQIQTVKSVAAEAGRTIKIGALSSIIVRETEEEAWAEFERRIASTPIEPVIAQADRFVQSFNGAPLAELTNADPQIQARIDALNAGRFPTLEELRFAPAQASGIWPVAEPAFDILGRGSSSYLVGSAETVAARIHEISDELGIDIWIFQSWPLIQEAEYVAKLLFPLLERFHPAPVLAD